MLRELLSVLSFGLSAVFAVLAISLVTGGADVGVNLLLTNKEASLGCILVAIYLLILVKKV